MVDEDDFTPENIGVRGRAIVVALEAAGIQPDRPTTMALIALVDTLMLNDGMEDIEPPSWLVEWRSLRGTAS